MFLVGDVAFTKEAQVQKEFEKIEESSCKQDTHTHTTLYTNWDQLRGSDEARVKHGTMVDIYMHASKVQEKLTGSRKHFNMELETQPNSNKE